MRDSALQIGTFVKNVDIFIANVNRIGIFVDISKRLRLSLSGIIEKIAISNTLGILTLPYRTPLIGVADVVKETGYSRQGAYNMIERLIAMEILYARDDTTEYGQKYEYRDYLSLFQEVGDG